MTCQPPSRNIHHDHEIVLREQLAKIREQISERERVKESLEFAIEQELLVIGSAILNAMPGPFTTETSDERRDRLSLQRDRQTLTREHRDETRNAWHDRQKLEEERRTIERELLTTKHQRERLDNHEREPA